MGRGEGDRIMTGQISAMGDWGDRRACCWCLEIRDGLCNHTIGISRRGSEVDSLGNVSSNDLDAYWCF
jgi:hypothetical protein